MRAIDLTNATSGLSRVAVSPDGRLVAVVGTTVDFISEWLYAFRVADGKRVFSFQPTEYGLVFIGWHPTKPIVAFQGATGEPMGPEMYVYRGFGVANIAANKTRFFPVEFLEEDEPFDWLPDKVNLFSDYVIVNTKTGKQTVLAKIESRYGLRLSEAHRHLSHGNGNIDRLAIPE